MPRFDIRYDDPTVRDLLKANASTLTAEIATIMSTDDPKGGVLPKYVKLELTFAPDDINVRSVSVNVSARAIPGRIGEERVIARRLRAAFVAATEGRYSVGVWVALSAHSAYREYMPE